MQGSREKNPLCTSVTLTSFDLILAFCGSFHFPQFRIQINSGFSFSDSFYCSPFLFQPSKTNTAAVPGIFLCLVKEFILWYDFIFFLSLQECLEKCGESLQEIINYHMVSRPCTPPRTARWYHPDWLLKASRGSSIPSRTILRVRTELGLHVDFFSHTSLKSVCVTVSQSGDHISKPQRTRKTHDAVFSRAPSDLRHLTLNLMKVPHFRIRTPFLFFLFFAT